MQDIQQQQALAEHFRQAALEQGFTFGQTRLEAAAASHRAMRPVLEKLRHVPMAFVGDVIEPSTARGWLESGGNDQ
jgi:hypothetical protein